MDKGGIGKAPANLIVKLVRAHMQQNGWNNKRYLISGYPRNAKDMKVWNDEMAATVSTIGVLYLNLTYLEMKKRYLSQQRLISQTSELEGSFNELFSNWKSDTCPVVEKFRPKGMLYEANCPGGANQDMWNDKSAEIIDMLLGLGEAALKDTIIDADGIEMELMDSTLIPQDKLDSETDAGLNENWKALADTGSMPYPIKIHSQTGEDIWWKLDDTFYVPKVAAYFEFYFMRDYQHHFEDTMSSDDKQERLLVDDIYLRIWEKLFMTYHFRNDMYRAQEADCTMSFSTEQKSFKIMIDCFSDTLPSFIEVLGEKMASFRDFDNENVWNSMKETVVKNQDDFWLREPYKIAREYSRCIMKVGYRPHHLYRKVLDQLSYNDYMDFCRTRIWDKLFVEAFFGGNILQEDCPGLYNTLNSGFNSYKPYAKLKRSEWNHLCLTRVWNLQSNQDHVYARITLNKDENNCGIIKHYQMEPNPETQKQLKEGYESLYMDPYALGDVLPMYNKNVARQDLLKKDVIFMWMGTWLSNLFYKELRTEQQLGYVVSAFEANIQGNKGMNFVVQSENTEPSNISAKIDQFLGDSEKILEDMTDEEFN